MNREASLGLHADVDEMARRVNEAGARSPQGSSVGARSYLSTPAALGAEGAASLVSASIPSASRAPPASARRRNPVPVWLQHQEDEAFDAVLVLIGIRLFEAERRAVKVLTYSTSSSSRIGDASRNTVMPGLPGQRRGPAQGRRAAVAPSQGRRRGASSKSPIEQLGQRGVTRRRTVVRVRVPDVGDFGFVRAEHRMDDDVRGSAAPGRHQDADPQPHMAGEVAGKLEGGDTCRGAWSAPPTWKKPTTRPIVRSTCSRPLVAAPERDAVAVRDVAPPSRRQARASRSVFQRNMVR